MPSSFICWLDVIYKQKFPPWTIWFFWGCGGNYVKSLVLCLYTSFEKSKTWGFYFPAYFKCYQSHFPIKNVIIIPLRSYVFIYVLCMHVLLTIQIASSWFNMNLSTLVVSYSSSRIFFSFLSFFFIVSSFFWMIKYFQIMLYIFKLS